MDVLAPILIIALLLGVVALVTAPLRSGRSEHESDAIALRIADLQGARDAKYRELRELDLDHRTGKVTPEDFRTLDRRYRTEAVAILRELDELEGRPVGARVETAAEPEDARAPDAPAATIDAR